METRKIGESHGGDRRKYNIFTVANAGYSLFLKMFIGSIYDKVNYQFSNILALSAPNSCLTDLFGTFELGFLISIFL